MMRFNLILKRCWSSSCLEERFVDDRLSINFLLEKLIGRRCCRRNTEPQRLFPKDDFLQFFAVLKLLNGQLKVRSEEGEKTRADFTTSPNDRLRNGMVSLLHISLSCLMRVKLTRLPNFDLNSIQSLETKLLMYVLLSFSLSLGLTARLTNSILLYK